MATVSNVLAKTSPFSESYLEAEVANTFAADTALQSAVSKLLESLSQNPSGQGYKFTASVSKLHSNTTGPIQTYAGGYWNEQTDGTWTHYLSPQNLVVTVTWIKT